MSDRETTPREDAAKVLHLGRVGYTLPAEGHEETWSDARPPEVPRQPTEPHPLLVGLWKSLPPPDTLWTPERREAWLNTARHIFSLIYKDGGNG